MRYMTLILGFAFIVHVKAQLEVDVEDILYGEEDEEDDETGASTTTTRRTRTRRSTTTAPPTTAALPSSTPPPYVIVGNLTHANGTTTQNHTFILTQSNNSFFGSQISSLAGQSVTTERVTYVLGQVGRIWNNVGSLNITGIVDQSLGIRNHVFVRPLITGILNAVFCNPITFSNNNCRKRGKNGEYEYYAVNETSSSTTVPVSPYPDVVQNSTTTT